MQEPLAEQANPLFILPMSSPVSLPNSFVSCATCQTRGLELPVAEPLRNRRAHHRPGLFVAGPQRPEGPTTLKMFSKRCKVALTGMVMPVMVMQAGPDQPATSTTRRCARSTFQRPHRRPVGVECVSSYTLSAGCRTTLPVRRSLAPTCRPSESGSIWARRIHLLESGTTTKATRCDVCRVLGLRTR